MRYLFKNALVWKNSAFVREDAPVELSVTREKPDDREFVFANGEYLVLPGFCDVHVHLREPGFSYKETIASGTAAAARGGYTDVCTMPNLDPVPDTAGHLNVQLDIAEKSAAVGLHPYGAITVGEQGLMLSDMEDMAPMVCGFTDDGRGVQNEELMRSAMRKAAALGKVIAAHCEDARYSGGVIAEGEYARAHGYRGIPAACEWKMVERDLRLAKETGCRYHVCHVSAKESVELIRRAKAEGVDVTAETCPHYLTLNDSMLREHGRFKMNPPIRGEEDRLALLQAVNDGTIDMIVTDHAPHSAKEKHGGLARSLMGVTGLETAFPILYTKLVRTGALPAEKLPALLTENPRRRFGIAARPGDVCVWEVGRKYAVDPETFLSQGKSTPFDGEQVFGKCVLTVYDGRAVWREPEEEA